MLHPPGLTHLAHTSAAIWGWDVDYSVVAEPSWAFDRELTALRSSDVHRAAAACTCGMGVSGSCTEREPSVIPCEALIALGPVTQARPRSRLLRRGQTLRVNAGIAVKITSDSILLSLPPHLGGVHPVRSETTYPQLPLALSANETVYPMLFRLRQLRAPSRGTTSSPASIPPNPELAKLVQPYVFTRALHASKHVSPNLPLRSHHQRPALHRFLTHHSGVKHCSTSTRPPRIPPNRIPVSTAFPPDMTTGVFEGGLRIAVEGCVPLPRCRCLLLTPLTSFSGPRRTEHHLLRHRA